LDRLIPIVALLGFGGLLGWSAAHFLKTAGRLVGCACGALFILLQVLAYYGLAEIHWDKIARVAPPAEVASGALRFFWKILTYNLPFTGGFTVGFWRGWKA
jgi:uncharacterized membrane protein (Fun14 family)